MHTAYLALGTNIGDKKKMLGRAVELLGKNISLIIQSKIYETKPWGFKNQENFFNLVLKVETKLSPRELLREVKNTEEKLGRKKRFLNGPREIDIDILFYGNLIFNEIDLVIPHPRLKKRDFVLKPLIDLSPNFIDPETGKTVKDLYKDLLENEKTIIKEAE